jgi:hypothetical protein
MMRTIRSFAWLSILALPISSFGAIFQVVQLSEPAGFLSQTDAIQQGTNHPSVTPALSSNGYAFGYWTIDDVRVTGTNGRSLTQVSSVIQAASTYKAHYFQESADSDSDGIMDWFEYRMFGDLSRGPGDDPDGDGFTNQREDQLAQDPLVQDVVRDGGLSSRTSFIFTYADTSMVKATVESDPVGFVTQTENFLALNANLSTANLNGETNGYHFAYWSVNGVRQAAPNGTASSQVDLNVSVTSEIIAHYLPSNEDSDSDGVMDWFELHQFGNLSLGPNDDPDGDGFPNKLEGELGQEARVKDLVVDGGLSSRASAAFTYADTSMVQATIKSDPAGFVSQTENYLAVNANVSTASLNGETNGYHFAYWSVNGVRQTAPNGTSASQVDMNLTVTSQIIAHYLPSNEDSDSDGVMDWFELHQFGNLTLGPDDDPDGDGFSNKREGELGQEARVKDLVRDGGLSSRVSPSILYFLQVNNPPDGLDLNGTIVHANKPADEQVGIFQPSDPDDPNGQNAYQLSFLEGNGSTDKYLFTISGMNLLSSASLQVGNYSINVRVKDDENASFDKNFTIQAIHDPNKDDDNDSLTYAQEQALGTSDSNPDTDGDGFGDAIEASYGSNPADPNSVANSPPTDLNSTAPLGVAENQPAGTVVGGFHATDPDANATLTYTLVNGAAQNDNVLFTLDTNGTLRTAVSFDYEATPSLIIRVQAKDEHNASVAGNFTVSITDVFENSSPADLNSTAPLSVAENQPVGAIVGGFTATDPDAGANLTYTLVLGATQNDNHLFTLDTNGTLKTATVFDYESNASTYSIRVQVTDEHNATITGDFTVSLTDDSTDNPAPEQEYQTPGGNYQTPGGEYQSPTGGHVVDGNTTDHNESIPYPTYAYVPIAHTFFHQPDANGSFSFSGMVLTDGGSPVLETGILISKRLSFSEYVRLPAELDPQTQEFSIVHNGLDPGTTYYYRAYARNAVGENPGTRRKLRTPEAIDPSLWWAQMPEVGGGWRNSEWFGTFRMQPNVNWIYHAKLGWLFPVPDDEQGLWLWTQDRGWLWTQPGVFPYLWRHDIAGWLRLLGTSNGKPVFWDYVTSGLNDR